MIYSSLVATHLSDQLEGHFQSLGVVARTARETTSIHNAVDGCAEKLQRDLGLLMCGNPLTEAQMELINEHLVELGQLVVSVETFPGFGSKIKDAFSSTRVEAKSNFRKVVDSIREVFASIEVLVRNKSKLDGDEGYFAALLDICSYTREALYALASSGHARAQSDIIREVKSGSRSAIKFYCSQILENKNWPHDSFKELTREDPKILTVLLKELQGRESLNSFSLKALLELTNEGDAFSSNCLATLFFSFPNIFMEQVVLEAESGDRVARGLLIAFCSENHDPVLEERLRGTDWAEDAVFFRVRQIQEWESKIPQSRRHSKEIHWDDRPLILREKIVFQQVMRQNILVELLVEDRGKPIPPAVMSKCFPLTRTWLVGVRDDIKGFYSRERYLPKALFEIGKAHAIESVMAGSERIRGVRCLSAPSPANKWVQDNYSLALDRGGLVFRSTALCSKSYSRAIDVSRAQRSFKIPCSNLGLTHNNGEQLKAIEFAHALGIPFSINPCFTEEGNSLVGRDEEGNPYVIVGEDTIAWVIAQIREDMRDLGYIKKREGWKPLSEAREGEEVALSFKDDIKPLLAQNYGVSPEHVYPCEQPAEFHLDKAMKIIGPKVVMINDSFEAAEDMLKSLPRPSIGRAESTIAIFKNEARRKKKVEDKTAVELEAQGFTVVRFGGATYNPLAEKPEKNRINLFNFVSATAPGREKVVVAMGCPSSFETKFRAFLYVHCPDVRAESIHFLDEKWCRGLLSTGGGVECTVKAISVAL